METKLEGVEELELVKNRLDGVVENWKTWKQEWRIQKEM